MGSEAEYLVSQSTATYLTVVSGSGADDAVLGMAEFKGDTSQQWFVQGGVWEWGGDRSLCLAPNDSNNRPCLIPKDSKVVQWEMDSDERFTHDNIKVLDVSWPQPRTEVTLYPKHDGMNQKWWLISHLKAIADYDSNSLPTPILSEVCYHVWPQEGEPDYLINQSSQTVISVLSGSGTSDAVVGMAPYDGGVRQQWHYKNQQLLWGQDQNLCLAPKADSDSLTLAITETDSSIWTFDQEGFMSCEGKVLDVPWEEPRERVILYSKHGGLNQMWWNLASLLTADQPQAFQNKNCNYCKFKKELALGFMNSMSSPLLPLPYPRNVSQFPGHVSPTQPLITASVALDLTTLGQRSNLRIVKIEDWQSTDLYVRDDEPFQVVLPESLSQEQASQIKVRISPHVDQLTPTSSNVSGSTFRRMPIVTELFYVKPGINDLRSQYGGNLIFTFTEGSYFETVVEVRNVVKCARYVLNTTTEEEWKEWKETMIGEIPYTLLESNSLVVAVPSASALAINYPDKLLKRYDQVVQLENDLSGFEESDPPPQGKWWFVDDIQITAGSAHAGFPAMFWRDYYDLGNMNIPYDWVTWHELGHNYQQSSWWSYAYGSETTNNLYSLYCQETLLGEDRLENENLYETTAQAVDEGLTWAEADAWQQLVFLMEIKKGYPEVGWEMFRILNRTTRALSDEDANILASTAQNQYDYVYMELSKAVGADLLPHYQRWGFQVSQPAQLKVSKMGLTKAPADLSRRKKVQ